MVAAEEQHPNDPVPTQTCYDFTGSELSNNTQCPGSNACCKYLHQCTENLLCSQDNSDEFINPPCAVFPWENCSNICHYATRKGYPLPRVERCLDGTFCCNADPQCCETGDGVNLDSRGQVVPLNSDSSSAPEPTLKPTSSNARGSSTPSKPTTSPLASDSTSISTSATTSDITPDTTSDITLDITSNTLPDSASGATSSPGSNNSKEAKIAIGVAVPCGVLICALIGVFFVQRRKNSILKQEADVRRAHNEEYQRRFAQPVREIPSNVVSEMPSNKHCVELPSDNHI
ncbi:hypothetical protein FQN57_002601 [Myotisia sp. PD_48]|nr:hypothetical protein FQN57_002601 [Myotisia sp. PD_48]